jgi:hypothetical protein
MAHADLRRPALKVRQLPIHLQHDPKIAKKQLRRLVWARGRAGVPAPWPRGWCSRGLARAEKEAEDRVHA